MTEIIDIEQLWKTLASKYDISKITGIRFESKGRVSISEYFWDRSFDEKIRLQSYNSFIFNINRVMRLFEDFISVEPIITEREELWINLNYQVFSETILILLISSLEEYLADTFKILANEIQINNINSEVLLKFIKKYNLYDNALVLSLEKNNFQFPLADILPLRLNFQNKDFLKINYSVIDIDLPSIDYVLWGKIFSKDEDSYIQTRHRLVHEGSKEFLEIKRCFSREYIKKAILDIIEYVYKIEYHISSKLPPENQDL
ncbi:hypothetical protein LCGC14_2079710 [marine sediment metagenome]|uniref:RiboL-PSP-HEPN domain-containing protein n=1 Tax=marine sediment metagenome TaxID=412755 RepID=A0A0F9EG65_9ZZZZ|nr:MAG: hypothetical protein Lokiarch_19020 [Candidatus Lokiarchaeum sp. GC14_75]